jgi:hypothetical protein
MYLREFVADSICNVGASGCSTVCAKDDSVFEVYCHTERRQHIMQKRNPYEATAGSWTAYIEVPRLHNNLLAKACIAMSENSLDFTLLQMVHVDMYPI